MDVDPLTSDDDSAECVGVELLTNAMLRERGYRHSGQPYELAFERRDGSWIVLPIESLTRVRQIFAELALPADAIDVLWGIDVDRETLLAQATGKSPVYLQ
jgi:hypothetical protein